MKTVNTLEKLAEQISNTKYENLPDEVILAVKKSLIDTIGVSILGKDDECVLILKKLYKNQRTKLGATVWGEDYKLPIETTVLINGTAAHALDFDDTGASTQGHPSAPLFPSLLALCEKNDFNGEKLIEAYVAGVEVFNKLSQSVKMLHLNGWHPTPVLGTIANAAACSKLLDLDNEQIRYAVGMSSSLSSGLVANFGTMTKPLHVGRAGVNGVFSALAAQQGFRSSNDIFEHDKNLFFALTQKNQHNLYQELSSFGNPFSVIDPGINIKKYPSCSLSHRAIDITLDIIKSEEINVSNIKNIICRVTPRAKKVLFYDKPKTGLEAKFSMPFVLSIALKFQEVTPKLFTNKIVNTPSIKKLISKVDFDIHHDWKDGVDDWRPDTVEIVLESGKTFRGESVYPEGHAKNPLKLEQVKEKYLSCTKHAMGLQMAEKSYNEMLEINNKKTINPLIETLNFNING